MKRVATVGLLGVTFLGGWFLGSRKALEVPGDGLGDVEAAEVLKESQRIGDRMAAQSARIQALEISLAEANAKLSMTVERPGETQAPENPFRLQMENRIQRRVDNLAERLGLSDLQKSGLRDIFLRRVEYFEARRTGSEVEPFNLDAELEAVLNPEQFARYMEETQEEIYNRAELIATGQLVRMNQLLELDASVQELVYEAVHITAQEMMIARETGASFSMREAMDERLGTLLTEEQMRVVREEADVFVGAGMGPGGVGRGGRGP